MNEITDQRTPEQMLEEFQTTFDVNISKETRQRLIREEMEEVLEAAAHLLKEITDLAYVVYGAEYEGLTDAEIIAAFPLTKRTGQLIADLIDAFSPETQERAFRAVHYNNMSKVQPDGTVKRREDGKVLKPDGYQPVDLGFLVN
jgi:predicted HAD superfamily Cof-like phosphohydrolase